MSILRFGRLVTIAAAFCLIGPAALAQAPTADPRGATFQCDDGSKMVVSFAETGKDVAALVWVRGGAYRLLNLPPEPNVAKVVWSDGEHSLTWTPGVQLMWMATETHLMCGRSGHKH
jgi:hypothetical protein